MTRRRCGDANKSAQFWKKKIGKQGRVLWSLELASEFFHDFFAYDFGGEDSDSAGRNSRKNTVAKDAQLARILESRKGNLVTGDARSGVKKFATGMWIKIAFLLPLFFLLG